MEVVLVLIGAGAVVALIQFANARAKKRREQWEETARTLGLTFAPGPYSDRPIRTRRPRPEMYGQVDGQDVYVGVRSYTTGSGKNQQTHYYTFIDVIFDVPLKRGLVVGKADGVSKFFGSIFGQADMQTGRETLDVEYKIRGQDAQQVTAIVAAPEVERLLLAPRDRFVTYVSDGSVRLEAHGDIVEKEVIAPRVPEAVALARAVMAAWIAAPPSAEERRVEPIWRRVCETKGFAYQARGMRGTGTKHDLAMRIEAVVDEKGWATEIEAMFEPPLAVGLSLTNEHALSGITKFFGAQDITIGQARFDDEFVVKGKDPQLVKEILSAAACAKLLALRDRGDKLTVNDDIVMLRVRGIVEDPELLASLIDDVAQAGKDMVTHRKPVAVGPYR